MSYHPFLKVIIGSGFLYLSLSATTAFADGTSKDDWIRSLREFAPAAVCKSFQQDSDLNKKLAAAHISYDKCLTLIPASFDKCQAKYYSQIPATITSKDADKWGNNIGLCIGGDFTVNNLIVP